MESMDADDAIWEALQEALLPSTTEAMREDEAKPGLHHNAQLNLTANAEGSDTFPYLPMKERERILEEIRAASASEISDMTIDKYIAQRRKEGEREA